MSEHENPAGDRLQQIIKAFDPERNFRAMADLLESAVSSSEEVLGSISTQQNGSPDETASTPLRDAIAETERSFARLYDAAGQFMVERPMRASGAPGQVTATADIVVIDGVGTTSVQIPHAEHVPHCSDLRSHDGASIPHQAVAIRSALTLQSDGDEESAPTFVIRVDVPAEAVPGTYHSQLLVQGLEEVALTLKVRVIAPEDS